MTVAGVKPGEKGLWVFREREKEDLKLLTF